VDGECTWYVAPAFVAQVAKAGGLKHSPAAMKLRASGSANRSQPSNLEASSLE
jgi:hypothetical protein